MGGWEGKTKAGKYEVMGHGTPGQGKEDIRQDMGEREVPLQVSHCTAGNSPAAGTLQLDRIFPG